MTISSEPTDRIPDPDPGPTPAPLENSLPALRHALHAAVQRIETLEGEVNELRQRVGGIRRKQAFGS